MTAPVITSDLYQTALLAPAGASNTLHVASGYATPAMLSRLLTDLADAGLVDVEIRLVVGMVGFEGVYLGDHAGFVTLQRRHPRHVHIFYTTNGQSVHSKLYIWKRGATYTSAFAGSSNFTQNGFLIGARRTLHSETLGEVEPTSAESEFQRIESGSISILHPNIGGAVPIKPRLAPPANVANNSAGPQLIKPSLPSVILPLVASQASGNQTIKGGVHHQWGLNWGQRGSRPRNEAVIPYPVKAKSVDPEFFPRGTPHSRPQFSVTTDDGRALFMCVAEQGDKALHSLPSNSTMGLYFRDRLGVASGAPVSTADLHRFGSRFVRFTKLDDESFYLEYNRNLESAGSHFYNF